MRWHTFRESGKMSLWARDQKEIIDHDTVTTSGLQGYLASYQALGVFDYAALEVKLEGEALAMIQDQTFGNAKSGRT